MDESTGVSQLIERTLRDRIVSGALAPETPLRQDHIAREFQVSIASVREALCRLESAGLATSRPRRGVVVAPASADDLWEVLEMRVALEIARGARGRQAAHGGAGGTPPGSGARRYQQRRPRSLAL